MENRLKKWLSIFGLSTLILVSVLGVCKEMLTPCGPNCSPQTMGAVHANDTADVCIQGDPTCSAPIGDHMMTFAGIYPSVAAENFVSLLSVAAAVLAIAWFLTAKHKPGVDGTARAKIRSLTWRFSNSIAPDFLLAAFSRGILHSKIYA